MPSHLLSQKKIEDFITQYKSWKYNNKSFNKVFKFEDFVTAFDFMSQCAVISEKLNHHPEWSNNYNQVSIKLCTHSIGGLSQLDIQLAQAMDKIASTMINPTEN